MSKDYQCLKINSVFEELQSQGFSLNHEMIKPEWSRNNKRP